MGPGICIYVQQGRKSEQPCFGTVLPHRPASVVVEFKVVRLKVYKNTLEVVPPKQGHQRIPPDWVAQGVTTFEYAFFFRDLDLHGFPSLDPPISPTPHALGSV